MDTKTTYNIDSYEEHQESRCKPISLSKEECQKILKSVSKLKDMAENGELGHNTMTILWLNDIGSVIANK